MRKDLNFEKRGERNGRRGRYICEREDDDDDMKT